MSLYGDKQDYASIVNSNIQKAKLLPIFFPAYHVLPLDFASGGSKSDVLQGNPQILPKPLEGNQNVLLIVNMSVAMAGNFHLRMTGDFPQLLHGQVLIISDHGGDNIKGRGNLSLSEHLEKAIVILASVIN